MTLVRERYVWWALVLGLVLGFWLRDSWADDVVWSWAQELTGRSGDAPEVERVSHAWLRDHACAGRECRVLGWTEGGRIYLDDRLDLGDQYAASILLHEYAHILQGEDGAYGGCAHAMDLEREAYAVQREYLLRMGSYAAVIAGATMHGATCVESK